jgi:hypothetical protein
MGRVVRICQRKEQLLAMVSEWGRWYPVEQVLIVAASPIAFPRDNKGD